MYKIVWIFLLKCVVGFEIMKPEAENFHTSSNKFEKILTDFSKNAYANKKTETARKFLEIYNSINPVLVLVDDVKETSLAASNFVKNLQKASPAAAKNLNFFLMKYNSSGATPILVTSQTNLEKFHYLLNEENIYQTSYLGPKDHNGTLVFFGILNAAFSLPNKAGIVVFLDRRIGDEDLIQQAVIAVKKKQIRVFVIWGGLYPTQHNEERLLKEFCKYSGGDFLVNSDRNLSHQNMNQFLTNGNNGLSASVLLSRNNLLGEQSLSFPIDSDVTGIHINLSPYVTSGILTTPRGHKIDLLEDEEVALYASGSFVNRDTGLYEIHLNTTKAPTLDVGIWRLKLNNARATYNVTVFVYTKLTADVYISKNITGIDPKLQRKHVKKYMNFDIIGEVTLISNISFVSQDGKPILDDKLKYTIDKDLEKYVTENIDHVQTEKNKDIQIEISKVPQQPFYALIQGKDSNGHEFERLSYVRSYGSNEIFPKPPLTIDVGLGSELITRGGKQSEIYFEVTNHGTRAVDVRFTCRDEKYILYSMNPYRKVLSPEETATVRVTLNTRYGTYKDQVTFSAIGGLESVEKNVILDVGTDVIDNHDPELHYKFTSDCTNVLIGDCEDATWTVEVTAKDTGSGLLQLSSIPKGLYVPNGFTTGTREMVTGYYSESCCNHDLQLIAVDRSSRRTTRNVNGYLAIWSAGAIAAIILGILLIIILIIVIVILIKKCLDNRDTYRLPVYRGRL